MSKVKLILAVGTLVGTTFSTVLVLSARNPDQQAAPGGIETSSETGNGPSLEEALLSQQAETEAELADMQNREADYSAQLKEANAKIEELNATLADLQAEAQTSHAAVEELQSKINYEYAAGAQYVSDIQMMQGREGQWQEAIAQADQTVAELEAYINQYNAAAAAPSGGGGGDGGGKNKNSNRGGGDDHHDDEHEDDDD